MALREECGGGVVYEIVARRGLTFEAADETSHTRKPERIG